jgi:UDP-N-acetylmuramate dehydrogenase
MEALCALKKLSIIENIPLLVIGSGSNMLFNDQGFPGIVIKLDECFTEIVWREDTVGSGNVQAGAGAFLWQLSREASARGFNGLLGCTGIPGTIGGAVVGNAGTQAGWIGDSVAGVDVLTVTGDIEYRGRDLLHFSYRSSNLSDLIVVSVHFSLKKLAKNDSVIEEISTMVERRKKTQPLGDWSAGCVFKNPAGDSAGRLIDACGLKGLMFGGACISEKHANFIVNTGTATASDVRHLIHLAHQKVKEQFGIELQLEIQIV